MRSFYLILLLSIPLAANCQNLDGIVVDETTGKPLFAAGVTDMVTQISTYTDKDGHFRLPAKSGDPIRISYIGYKTVTNITPASLVLAEMRVGMVAESFQLQEYTIHPDYTPYQLDSIARRNEYAKELDKTAVKPRFVTTGEGIGVNGLIGSLVQKASKSEKKRKKFLKEFKQSEESRFIDAKYTPQLVTSLTGYKDDSLAVFMNAYPMDIKFARSASDLEIKMWIRYNYRDYIKTGGVKKEELEK